MKKSLIKAFLILAFGLAASRAEGAQAPASLVPQTGQVASYGPGDDGALKAGVALPSPRFVDNQNGTITDNLTKLIWLKDGNCSGFAFSWFEAIDFVIRLNQGLINTIQGSRDCGDRSLETRRSAPTHQTDWRLPNVRELLSLVNFGYDNPAMSDALGGDTFPPFQILMSAPYWTSTTHIDNYRGLNLGWMVDIGTDGAILTNDKVSGRGHVLAVRGQ